MKAEWCSICWILISDQTHRYPESVAWRETTKKIRAEFFDCTLLFVVTLEQASSRTTDCQYDRDCRVAILRLIKAGSGSSDIRSFWMYDTDGFMRWVDLRHKFIYNTNLDAKARHGLSDLKRDTVGLINSETTPL
jgi:hypothetical protein